MKSVAFVTYNAVGNNTPNGWMDGLDGRRAFVLQNTKGEGSLKGKPIGEQNRREQLEQFWKELQLVLPELDQIVVYVGVAGSERAFALASELPPSKITFVSCTCSIREKERMLEEGGLTDVGRVICECGGHHTLAKMFDQFMFEGTLPGR